MLSLAGDITVKKRDKSLCSWEAYSIAECMGCKPYLQEAASTTNMLYYFLCVLEC